MKYYKRVGNITGELVGVVRSEKTWIKRMRKNAYSKKEAKELLAAHYREVKPVLYCYDSRRGKLGLGSLNSPLFEGEYCIALTFQDTTAEGEQGTQVRYYNSLQNAVAHSKSEGDGATISIHRVS